VRISSRCEYGLRAMIYLARAARDEPVPLTEIAHREDMPTAFLERILASLREGGLLASTRGASGGYRLTRPARAISVGDIVTAIEGPLSLVGCLPDEGGCARAGSCASQRVWRRLDDAISCALGDISLDELSTEAITT
jgi:Rrf2 family protein